MCFSKGRSIKSRLFSDLFPSIESIGLKPRYLSSFIGRQIVIDEMFRI